jgi:hypothetical protein
VLTDTVDWTEMEARAEKIREKKLKDLHERLDIGRPELVLVRDVGRN